MNLKLKLSLLLITTLSIASCSKNASVDINNPPVEDTLNTIYVSGHTDKDSKTVPAFWKNGSASFLGNGYIGYASDIAVSGSDVYVLVDTLTAYGDNPITTVWKNGIKETLGQGT